MKRIVSQILCSFPWASVEADISLGFSVCPHLSAVHLLGCSSTRARIYRGQNKETNHNDNKTQNLQRNKSKKEVVSQVLIILIESSDLFF